jgi:hypothetical protein
MEEASEAVELWIQLGAAGLMVAVLTLIHGLGLVGISKLFKLQDERLEEHAFDSSALVLMATLAFSLFILHALEIGLIGGFYMAIGAIGTIEEALFYSASAYATLGYTAEYFPENWRLLAASEALVGFLLLGWSTAFLVHNINKLRD